MPLLVCRTCPRYEPDSGSFAECLDRALADAPPHGVRIRHVPCIGGCPEAGNAALDGPGKARVRFSDLCASDATDLLVAAVAYDASSTGSLDDWEIPPSLTRRITAVTPKKVASSDRFSRPDGERLDTE